MIIGAERALGIVLGPDGGPIGYVIVRLIVYFGCLAVILVAIGAILQKRAAAVIPPNTQEYAEFIKRNRAMQEHRSRAKLMILITCVFLCIEGPYITMCFFYETYNSREFSDVSIDIPQDADTLITWLKFVFPLICPIIMLSWCNDVWTKVKEVMCCRSYDPPTIGHMPGLKENSDVSPVMTVVAGDHGLRVKADGSGYPMRPQWNSPPSVSSYESDTPSSVTQETNIPAVQSRQVSSVSTSTPSPSETPKTKSTIAKKHVDAPSRIPRQIPQFKTKRATKAKPSSIPVPKM
ncbi:unnamed protein product [Caenorhabditis sp. 36 PRJEB53466]|nr:unnamed protein product [Caenorhabditis sp. 36 PRJEB53466]